jgi:hypothetical protein
MRRVIPNARTAGSGWNTELASVGLLGQLGADSPRHRRLMRIIIASLSGFWPIIVGLLQHGA